MNSPARIAEEFLQLRDSDFWKLYNTELDRMMSTRLDRLRNGAIDTILYTQGEVKSIEMVKGLPERILSELAEKSRQGE
jgi:hypothetical protein